MLDREKLAGGLVLGHTSEERVIHRANLIDREVILDQPTLADWAIYNGKDTTANIAYNAASVLGARSLEFDKVDGADAVVYAGVQKVLSPALDLSRFLPDDIFDVWFNIPNKANVVNAQLILGTDVSNNKAFTVLNAAITAGVWDSIGGTLATGTDTGNGWNQAAVAYVAFIVNWDLETRALANVILDSIFVRSARS